MDRGDRPASRRGDTATTRREDRIPPAGHHRERDAAAMDTIDETGDADIDAGNTDATTAAPAGHDALPGNAGEQAEFREQFDEDLYNDREDRPAQGNTADVAMGEHRFGSEADAYSEYAWRRPGDHHRGDASAVGQSRDPADIADEDGRP